MNEFTTDVFMTKLLKNESYYFEFFGLNLILQTIYLTQRQEVNLDSRLSDDRLGTNKMQMSLLFPQIIVNIMLERL